MFPPISLLDQKTLTNMQIYNQNDSNNNHELTHFVQIAMLNGRKGGGAKGFTVHQDMWVMENRMW